MTATLSGRATLAATLTALAAAAVSRETPGPRGRRWFRMANGADVATVHVYDVIGGWDGVVAVDFVRALGEVSAKRIDVHINSPGGDVFDAISIHAALVNHAATVHTIVDGMAASAASVVAMAGDRIAMEKPARMMIHDASALTWGNEADHLKNGALLGSISDTIAQMYADRATTGTAATWRTAMLAETWYTAAAALDLGLVDEVLNDVARETSDAPAALDRRTQLIRARARGTLKGGR